MCCRAVVSTDLSGTVVSCHTLWYTWPFVLVVSHWFKLRACLLGCVHVFVCLFVFALLVLLSQVFDVIVGTSTGGILAMLFASEKKSLLEVSTLYDSLVVQIFKRDILGSAKLVLQQVCDSKTPHRALPKRTQA